MALLRRAVHLVGLTLLAVALSVPGGTAPAGAQAERMHLVCEEGLVIERSNGSSWWGLGDDGSRDGSVYVTRQLMILAGSDVVFEHSYGEKGGQSEVDTCVAGHFDSTWIVEVVRVR